MDAPVAKWTLTEDIDERALPFLFDNPRSVVRYAMVCKRLRMRIPLAGVLLALYKRRMCSPITAEPYPVAGIVLDFCMARETLSFYTRVRQAWVIMFRILFRTLRLFDPEHPVKPGAQEIAMWPPVPMALVFNDGAMPPSGTSETQRYLGKLLDLSPGEVLSGTYEVTVRVALDYNRCDVAVTIDFDRTKNEYYLHPIDPTALWKAGGFGGHTSLGPKLPSADALWEIVQASLRWHQRDDNYKSEFHKRYAQQEKRDATWPILCEYTFL